MSTFLFYVFAFWVVIFFAFIFVPGHTALGMYARNIMITATQFLNTLTGGHPDQSFSGRSAINKERKKKGWKYIVDVIDGIFKAFTDQDDHCSRAIERDRPAYVNYPGGWKNVLFVILVGLFIHAVAQILIHIS
jgi:hypothetical protein